MSLEDLAAEAGELLNRALQEGYDAGVAAERSRIASLLGAPVAEPAKPNKKGRPPKTDKEAPKPGPAPVVERAPVGEDVADSVVWTLVNRVLKAEEDLLPTEILEAAINDDERALSPDDVLDELERGKRTGEYSVEEHGYWKLNQ